MAKKDIKLEEGVEVTVVSTSVENDVVTAVMSDGSIVSFNL